MKNLPVIYIASTLWLCVLGGCGGSGGGTTGTTPGLNTQSPGPSPAPTAPSPTPTPPAPQSSTVPALTSGDFSTYRSTLPSVNYESIGASVTAANYLSTLVIDNARADGSADEIALSGGANVISSTNQIVQGGHISASGGNRTCGSVYTPAWAVIPLTLSVGLQWENSTTLDNARAGCTSDLLPLTKAVKGVVAGSEAVTVAAGKFDTLKITYRLTTTRKDLTRVSNTSCWRDVVSGLHVKCESHNVDTPTKPGEAISTYDIASELVGYANAATGRRLLSVARFAGTWTGNVDLNWCEVDIDADGVVAGTCTQHPGIFVYDITGKIDATGNVTMAANGLTYRGAALNPREMNDDGRPGQIPWRLSHI